mmetsp:Transcript_13544/g.43220  ORF Transcript_13544/g.43220 Transcript_13544/m.43220 type:complete len:125 (-) Transcript_13544:167-541(-)
MTAPAIQLPLLRGQQVKYNEKGTWIRAKVLEDQGAKVLVSTHGKCSRSTDTQQVLVRREDIARLPGRTGYSSGAGRALPVPVAPSAGGKSAGADGAAPGGGSKPQAAAEEEEDEEAIIAVDSDE